ncbi:MAG: TetR/AcrR family transcriptional regulator [Casimicrobiaceae bacterium]
MDINVNTLVEDKDSELVVRRRKQLVDAAIGLFSRVGFYVATVKDVAEAAGVSAGLVYQYVSDKQDLLFLCLVDIVERNRSEIPAAMQGETDPLSRLSAAIEAYTRVIATNRKAVLLTYRETKSLKPEYVEHLKTMELETNALLAACVSDCVKAGLLVSHQTELLVYQIITGAHFWALKYWRLRSITSLDQYIEHSIHSCWVALLTPAGRKRYLQMSKDGPNKRNGARADGAAGPSAIVKPARKRAAAPAD